jgi:hypothetical protein
MCTRSVLLVVAPGTELDAADVDADPDVLVDD